MAHDPVAAAGVPAHVTILFPFLPAEALTPSVRRRIDGAIAGVAPFEARFQRTGRFPGSLWLAPEPAGPFRAMTERVAAAFPDHPPYEGAHDDIVPHLTLAMGPDASLDRLEAAIREHGGGPAIAIRRVTVIVETAEGRWHPRWRIALRP